MNEYWYLAAIDAARAHSITAAGQCITRERIQKAIVAFLRVAAMRYQEFSAKDYELFIMIADAIERDPLHKPPPAPFDRAVHIVDHMETLPRAQWAEYLSTWIEIERNSG